MRRLAVVLVIGVVFSAFSSGRALRAEPGWSPVVVATGAYRRQIESTPIHLRPNRPLHFYGNTLRRLHYRGNPVPTLGDISQTLRLLLIAPTGSLGR